MSKSPAATTAKPKAEKKAKPKSDKPASAKKKKAAAAAVPAASAPANPVELKDLATKLGTDFKCPGEAEVVALVRRLKSAGKVAQEKAGEMGEMIAKAVETKHFDRTALAMVRKLEAMSDNKLQVTLPHFLMYIDALGLPERAKRQGQLIADQPASSPATGGAEMDDESGDDDGEGPTTEPRLLVVPKDDDATAFH
jgi:hypothetical protein